MIQLDEYYTSPDKDCTEYRTERGLGLLRGFGIEPHFENSDFQKETIHKFQRERNKDVYAIRDFGMVIVENGQIETIGDVTVFKSL